MSTTKGIVLFGVNNTSVNYVQLAVMAAAFIKKNMQPTNICLITDIYSKQYYEENCKWKLEDFFTDIVLLPESHEDKFENVRAYKDTRYYSTLANFKNETRSMVYNLTPYDETLLLDSDYLILNNSLSAVWGSVEEIMINKVAIGLTHQPLVGNEFRLNPFGIKMYWATAIYFRKGDKAEQLFNLVQHIKENWEYYQLLYDFPGSLFRNDYAFSIAIHILNGFTETGDFFAPLPDDTIFTALDTDQLYKINGPSDLSFFVNDTKETWKFYMSKIKGINVHCMNKLSLLNNMGKIMEVLSE